MDKHYTEGTVFLLKNGKPVRYGRCTVCDRYAQARTDRGWCAACELEFKQLKRSADGTPVSAPEQLSSTGD